VIKAFDKKGPHAGKFSVKYKDERWMIQTGGRTLFCVRVMEKTNTGRRVASVRLLHVFEDSESRPGWANGAARWKFGTTCETRLRSTRSIVIDNNTLTISQNISFLPAIVVLAPPHACTANFGVFFSKGPPGDRGALHCTRNAIATQLGQVPFSPRGLQPGFEEQSQTRGGISGGIADQPQHRRLWRSRTPNARSLSRSPSSPPPSFTQSPFLPRSLLGDGQTSKVKPRLVVSRILRIMQRKKIFKFFSNFLFWKGQAAKD
jgi:hypothetical protein